jgi:hypothetical protein
MFTQFHSRYPTGSLVSELVQIYDGSYIVRTLIQVGGVTLASGFAAATAIEEAEDHARWRALAVLGITPIPNSGHTLGAGYEPQAQLIDSGDHNLQARLNPSRSFAMPSHSSHPPIPEPVHLQPQIPHSQIQIPQQAGIEAQTEWNFNPQSSGPAIEEYEQFTPNYAPAPAAIPNRRKAEMGPPKGRGRQQPPNPNPPPLELDTTFDLSDIIAQTSVELKRLGWSESQGRTYLQRTYNKRSRQQLTDDELLDFLNYLQSEPSPGELAF